LKVLNRSPLHFWDRFINPDRVPFEPTPAMKLGTLAHCAILEPEEFDKRYIVVPEGINRTTKEGKQLWADLLATGREPVKSETWYQVLGMAQAVMRHPLYALIRDAVKEKPLFWQCKDTGVQCRALPDVLIAPCDAWPNGLILDLKTTGDIAPETFARRVWDGDMLIQAGYYSQAFYAAYGCWPVFGWIAVETDRPHAVKFYAATESQIEYGNAECLRLLRIYADCAAADNWPAYGDDITELELPAWASRIVDGDDDGSVEVSDV
jgi:exodeoxyribonuclease VIII